MSRDAALSTFAERWRAARPAEVANFQLYITELCEALGVEKPRPAGTGYEFELPVTMIHRDGTESHGRVDLFNEGRFLLEAKHEGGPDTEAAEIRLRRAFGQAANYAAHVPGGPPPYLMVLDVGRTLRLWDRWSGSYGGFQGVTRVIDLARLHEHPDDAAFLRLVWTKPRELDPHAKSAAVTEEIAAKLAELAARLEKEGEGGEVVARFLIRCVFTMFAEDVGLLKDTPFLRAVEVGLEQRPEDFASAVADLWAAMDEGKRFGTRHLLRFNGHFFHDREVLPLTRDELAVLLEAARADWAQVEPSIFGTLLTRALDPEERHRLGAEFTPRAYVERLVRPTIEEPVRERWTMVQAEVLQLRQHGTRPAIKKALRRLREYHDWLRSLRILDPACGSGNFLYVSLNILKEIELEVFREMEELAGGQKESEALEEVGPWQFHGIEIKPWAREVAELCLWVGYHQWWRRTHGDTPPHEPILRDTGTIEQRDAVLAWDERREVPEKSRPDPTPRIEHPVTGELVPDPEARLPYYEYVGARQAEWPEADFIVGNPPYMGFSRMREEFGDGYAEALQKAYEKELNPSVDYVMYWWHRASRKVARGETHRAGLITTNSIRQSYNRSVVEGAAEHGVRIIWAVPDHPWIDDAAGVAVRVSMTVTSRRPGDARLVVVDEEAATKKELTARDINPDLTVRVDVRSAAATTLLANDGLSSRGFQLRGRGFLLEPERADKFSGLDGSDQIIRPFVNGRDLAQRSRGLQVIDFGTREQAEAAHHAVLFDYVRTHVKPERDTNRIQKLRDVWWQFGINMLGLREAMEDLERYITTPYVSRHRFFVFLPSEIAPDDTVIGIAVDDAAHLGVLSSSPHAVWADAAGTRLGKGNDFRYNNPSCFKAFPFPPAEPGQREEIGRAAERIQAHRKAALARDHCVTMTAMYNVVEKLRSGEPLTEKERKVYEIAACGVLRDLHDELDRLVADAYGWPWPMETEEILARLVALHDERVEEERRGLVRWLRPDYQIPRFGDKVEGDLLPAEAPATSDDNTHDDLPAWPNDPIDQLTALRGVLDRPRTVEEAARRFRGARRADVEKHIEALEVLGVVARVEHGTWQVRGAVTVPAGSP